jgi:hypothetical protein
MKYLREVDKICRKLNIHIPWTLPRGLKENFSYIESEEIRITPFSYMKYSFVFFIVSEKHNQPYKQMDALR